MGLGELICTTCGGAGKGIYQKPNELCREPRKPETWFMEFPATCPTCHGTGRIINPAKPTPGDNTMTTREHELADRLEFGARNEFGVVKFTAAERDLVIAALRAGEGWRAKVKQFAEAILHGDEVHRAWLLEAADAFVSGRPLPEPRSLPPPPNGAGAATPPAPAGVTEAQALAAGNAALLYHLSGGGNHWIITHSGWDIGAFDSYEKAVHELKLLMGRAALSTASPPRPLPSEEEIRIEIERELTDNFTRGELLHGRLMKAAKRVLALIAKEG